MWGQTRTVESSPTKLEGRIRRILIRGRPLEWRPTVWRAWGRRLRRRYVLTWSANLVSLHVGNMEQMTAGASLWTELLSPGAFPLADLSLPRLLKGQTIAVTLSGRGTFDVCAFIEDDAS
jgi:hypothetical protein